MAHYRNGIILAIVALVIAVGTPAFSAKPAPALQLIIQSVIVQTNTLQINGENFGGTPVVTFAATVLTEVTLINSKQIVASLSSTPSAGTYRLTVVTGTSSTQKGEFYVTIGAVGAVGPPGPTGPAGVGSLGVYDGSGLFLGYYIEKGPSTLGPAFTRIVFNPDISAFLYIQFSDPWRFSSGSFSNLFYTTTDCSSQPYITVTDCDFYFVCAYGNFTPAIYYVYDDHSHLPMIVQGDYKATKRYENGVCVPLENTGGSEPAYPVRQIDVPLLNQTFQYPIVVKPVQ